ncbi:MAG: trehalose-phosphatase [Elioraea sp.]|nr:trehalose-phosphatase [Elioraea sp.]
MFLPDGLPRPQDDWALFLDLDGTLIDFAPIPEAARAPVGLASALSAAAEALGGALAIVSGREIAAIDRLLRPAKLAAAGCHGGEIRLSPDGVVTLHAPPLDPALVAEAKALAAAEGLLLEVKATGLALHVRSCPDREAAADALARHLAARAGADYEMLPGALVREVRPRAVDKGLAVRVLMGSPSFSGRRPIFVGDDVTDRDGIAAARALGGEGILLGQDTAADPTVVRAWLAALPNALGR